MFFELINKSLELRANGIQDWLNVNGGECQKKQSHLVDNSIERIYWHYGYMVALKDVLRLSAKTKIQQN